MGYQNRLIFDEYTWILLFATTASIDFPFPVFGKQRPYQILLSLLLLLCCFSICGIGREENLYLSIVFFFLYFCIWQSASLSDPVIAAAVSRSVDLGRAWGTGEERPGEPLRIQEWSQRFMSLQANESHRGNWKLMGSIALRWGMIAPYFELESHCLKVYQELSSYEIQNMPKSPPQDHP